MLDSRHLDHLKKTLLELSGWPERSPTKCTTRDRTSAGIAVFRRVGGVIGSLVENGWWEG